MEDDTVYFQGLINTRMGFDSFNLVLKNEIIEK